MRKKKLPVSAATLAAMTAAALDPSADTLSTLAVEAFDDGYSAGIAAVGRVLVEEFGIKTDNPFVRALNKVGSLRAFLDTDVYDDLKAKIRVRDDGAVH